MNSRVAGFRCDACDSAKDVLRTSLFVAHCIALTMFSNTYCSATSRFNTLRIVHRKAASDAERWTVVDAGAMYRVSCGKYQ